ncbi:MAG: hypothetical protein FWC40_03775 [Proteobacteria bacterium]|nr:hypothetical protein [Pseudomonadota bacterium]
MSEEHSDSLSFDFSVCCPDATAKAEPYHAIMFVDESGVTNGQLWGQENKLMLFEGIHAAQKLLEALNNPSYQLRGVTAAHLEALQILEADGRVQLFVIAGLTPSGDIEALPLSEHIMRRSKAGNPPPLRPAAKN